jgi:hypothetical protein
MVLDPADLALLVRAKAAKVEPGSQPDGMYGEVRVVLCVLRYRVGAYGDGNRLSPNRLDSQVHAHMSRNLRAIEQHAIQKLSWVLR